MPADGMRAAVNAKTEFRHPLLRQLEVNLPKFSYNGKSYYSPPTVTPLLLGLASFAAMQHFRPPFGAKQTLWPHET